MQWVKFKDKKPKNGDEVLVFFNDRGHILAIYDSAYNSLEDQAWRSQADDNWLWCYPPRPEGS